MSHSVESYLAAFFAVMFLMHVMFIFAWRMKRNDLADIVWGPGFLLVAIAALLRHARLEESLAGANFNLGEYLTANTRLVLAVVCVAIWGARLFWHVGRRNLSKKEEDVRYQNWRREWGDHWLIRTYLQVWVLQGLLMLVIMAPVLKIITSPVEAIGPVAIFGLALWVFGFLFEAIADEQLRRFSKNPAHKGKIIDTGLWRYSRHPNYFGEVVQWWGIYLLAVEVHGGWVTVFGPIAITLLILKVSGVPLAEALMQNRPGFAEYARRTSVFWPKPPKP